MARPSATALLLLLVSLLAIAHCRTLESDPATGTSTAETATVEGATDVVPAGILRLPSHRRHHPCHRGLWWAHHRHHGVFGDGHRFHRRGDAELVRDAAEADEEELKPVAEPDPDHSVTNVDDGGDGDDAAVKRWRKEELWRMFRHGLRHHHRHHHHEGDDEEEDHDQEEEKGRPVGVKRFRHHHRDEDDEEEQEEEMRKLFHPHADDGESDEELEEVVRRFRKAVMRRRFHLHGRFFRHHHHGRHHQHHHAEEQAEGGSVVTWIKGLMNRF